MPELQISVELSPQLYVLAEAPSSEAWSNDLARRCSDLLAELGLQAEPSVEILRAGNTDYSGRLLRLRVDGSAVLHPDDLPLGVYCRVSGHPMRESTASEFREWLETRRDVPGVSEWAVLCCLEILKRRPGLLLSRSILEAYLGSLPMDGGAAGRSNYTTAELHAILTSVLDLRVSLAAVAEVARILDNWGDARMPLLDAAETLLGTLRPEVIEILIEPKYLREITLTERRTDMFRILRDRLYRELGVRFPDFKFVESRAMGAHEFCFRVNHLTTPARRGLPKEKAIASQEALDGPSLLDPTDGSRCREVAEADPRNRGLQSADATGPLGYIVRALEADLRENAHCFVNSNLLSLAGDFPHLRACCVTRYSDHQIGRVLRTLAAEGFPLRDLRSVLSAALDVDAIHTDSRLVVFDDRLPLPTPPDDAALQDPDNVAAFIRTALKRQLTHSITRGRNRPVAHTLSPDSEGFILKEAIRYTEDPSVDKGDFREWFGEARQLALLDAIRRVIGQPAPTAPIPPILTRVEVRAWVRRLIADEFPRMQVLAHQELVPSANIQYLSSISADFSP